MSGAPHKYGFHDTSVITANIAKCVKFWFLINLARIIIILI